MDKLLNIWTTVQEQDGGGYLLLILFLLFVGAVGKWKLFDKAGQPASTAMIAAVVPVYDVIVSLRVVGRPAHHILFFLIPVYNIYFGFRLLIELAQSFGHFHIVDYVLAVVFNVFYVLNMGLAYNEEYYGPVYGHKRQDILSRKAQLA